MTADRTPDWFDLRILAPHFTPHVCNCLAEGDLEYLRNQLTRHLFDQYVLPGQDMYDAHGFFLTLRKCFGLGDSLPPQWEGLADRIQSVLTARPSHRAAIILTSTDVIMERDFSQLMTFVNVINDLAEMARSAAHRVQLCLFLTSHDAGFPSVDPVAQRRAQTHRGLKVMETDIAPLPWSLPREFTLAAQHHYTIPPAAWHYLSCGHVSRGVEEPWHAFEQSDMLTFVSAQGGWPCLEGVFARTRAGMTLVGIRHETDPDRFHIPADGEDPFTLFRGLCQRLAAWQSNPHSPCGDSGPSPQS